MGNSSAKPTGTTFKPRKNDDGTTDDIPVLPYVKQKMIAEQMAVLINDSIWISNFKRAYRGYLRRKPERGQEGTFLRIREQSTKAADQLGASDADSLAKLHEKILTTLGPIWYDDAKDYLLERNMLKLDASEEEEKKKVSQSMTEVMVPMAETHILTIAKKIYEKYTRGADFELSDVELDDKRKAKLDNERAEKIRKQAEERERQAREWAESAAMENQLHEQRLEMMQQLREQQKKIAEDGLI